MLPFVALLPSSPGRRTRAALLAAVFAPIVLTGTAGAADADAATPSTGWVRLAHFSPDTPEVDVYLAPFSAPASPAVFKAVGYGVLSEYQQLKPGRYSIGMRLAGAAPSSPVVITTNVTVKSAKAYTVAGVGRNADLALKVIRDDLSAAKAGGARLRVIQASGRAPVVSLRDRDGDTLAAGARFPSASPYVDLPAGARTLELVTAGGPVANTTLDAAAGGVYSLVVLDEGSGVTMLVRNDARSAKAAPKGGVATGLGGAMLSGPTPTQPGGLPAGGVALAALVLAGAGAVAGTRLRRAGR